MCLHDLLSDFHSSLLPLHIQPVSAFSVPLFPNQFAKKKEKQFSLCNCHFCASIDYVDVLGKLTLSVGRERERQEVDKSSSPQNCKLNFFALVLSRHDQTIKVTCRVSVCN